MERLYQQETYRQIGLFIATNNFPKGTIQLLKFCDASITASIDLAIY